MAPSAFVSDGDLYALGKNMKKREMGFFGGDKSITFVFYPLNMLFDWCSFAQ